MIYVGEINVEQSDVEYKNEAVKLRINNNEFESGELILTKHEIAWKKENSTLGFSIPWSKIVVQAISQDHMRSVYFMIDTEFSYGNNAQAEEIQQEEANNGTSENGDTSNDNEDFLECEDEDEHKMTEFWLVFDNPDDVDTVYYIMTKFPEPEPISNSDSDEEFFEGEDIEQMNINDDNDPRFAD